MHSQYFILEKGQRLGPFTPQELMNKPLESNDVVLLGQDTQGKEAHTLPEFIVYFKSEGIYYPAKENTAPYYLRLPAFVIDVVILTVIISVFCAVFFPKYIADPLFIDRFRTNDSYLMILKLAMFVILTVYNSVFESTRLQGSIGKAICGLAVVDELGYGLTFGQAFLRNFGKIVSEFIFYVGYLTMFFTERHQALHDLWSKCFVVSKSR